MVAANTNSALRKMFFDVKFWDKILYRNFSQVVFFSYRGKELRNNKESNYEMFS
jgi:hypothetical protein